MRWILILPMLCVGCTMGQMERVAYPSFGEGQDWMDDAMAVAAAHSKAMADQHIVLADAIGADRQPIEASQQAESVAIEILREKIRTQESVVAAAAAQLAGFANRLTGIEIIANVNKDDVKDNDASVRRVSDAVASAVAAIPGKIQNELADSLTMDAVKLEIDNRLPDPPKPPATDWGAVALGGMIGVSGGGGAGTVLSRLGKSRGAKKIEDIDKRVVVVESKQA